MRGVYYYNPFIGKFTCAGCFDNHEELVEFVSIADRETAYIVVEGPMEELPIELTLGFLQSQSQAWLHIPIEQPNSSLRSMFIKTVLQTLLAVAS